MVYIPGVVFLLFPMGKCMPLSQGIERYIFTLSLHENDKFVATPYCGDGGAGRRLGLTTNASFVLL